MSKERAPADSRTRSHNLSNQVPNSFPGFILILFFQTIRDSDHWVNVRPAERSRKKDSHQEAPCCLSINLVYGNETGVAISKEEYGNKFEGECLSIINQIDDTEGGVVKVTN